MKFTQCVDGISTITDFKRIASEYVVDFKRLPVEEIKAAIIKTAPQYSNEDNLKGVIQYFELHPNRNYRVLFYIFVRCILLNSDDFTSEAKDTENSIIAYEQDIIDKANEFSFDGVDNIEFYRYVVSAAWENNDDITPDEQNLINKIKVKMSISERYNYILEAQLGKFPTKNNVIHSRDEIIEFRRALQWKGIVFPVRDSNGKEYDIIPEEVAKTLRTVFNVDIKQSSFDAILNEKYVKSKSYLMERLEKAGVRVSKNPTVPELKEFVKANLTARQLLGGFSANDGLDKPTLVEWCSAIGVNTSGTKPDLIGKIIEYYDSIKQFDDKIEEDERELYYRYFTELASRQLPLLHQQNVISKDLECEHKFEDATNYIFEKIFKIKPLIMNGTEHPDGMLSFNDKLIMWDNKSKETPVSLTDHIKQFDRYISSSQKSVSIFMVIAPEFTDDSAKECVKYSLSSDTIILLITAEELKNLAERWKATHVNDQESLPLGIFKQSGRFNSALVVF